MKVKDIEGVLIDYRCKICRQRFDTPEEAQKCYARGVSEAVVPRGAIVALRGNEDMVFVVASFGVSRNEHGGGYRLWGFRDTKAGDNSEDEYCGDDLLHVAYCISGKADPRYYPLPESDKWLREVAYDNYKVNTKIPAFKRAVQFCKAMELEPQYWDGKKLVKVK